MDNKHSLSTVLIQLLLFSLMIQIASPVLCFTPRSARDRVRFGNVSFDPGTMWIVTNQGDSLQMTPNIPTPKVRDAIHLKVGPVMTGNVTSIINQLWTAAAEGKQIQGSITNDKDLLMGGGGNLYRHFANFQDGSAAYVIIAEVNNKFTPFVLTADNKSAANIGWTLFVQILMTLKGEPDSAGNTGGVTGGFSVGSPSDQGADPYDSIDWDGPDEFTFGIFDDHPIHPKNELTEAAMLNGNFIGSVQPKQLTFAEALDHVRLMLDNPKTKSEYEALKKQAANSDPFMLKGVAFAQTISGEPFSALLSLFAAYELYPNDPDSLCNLAAMLAHCGMPNESLAILKEMERRGMKPKPAAVNPDALLEYLKGFNQLLIGQTETGKGHLHRAINLDPFLKEASLALALAQKLTGETEEAEKTYIQGVWRRRPTQTLYCGGTGGKDGDPNNPYIRPPITDMLDVSKGKPGVLPQFDHPGNFSQALGLIDRYKKPLLQATEEDKGYLQQRDVIQRRLDARPKNADDKYYDYIETLIQTLEVQEPPVKKLEAARYKAFEEAHDAATKIGKQAMQKAVPILAQPGNHSSELQAIANDAVSAFRPFAQAYDQSVRRLWRTEYRYVTGLIAHIGDADWHQKEDLQLRAHTDSMYWGLLVGQLSEWYVAVAAVGAVKDPNGNVANVNHGNSAQCSENLRDTGVKVGIKIKLPPIESVEFSMKFTCEKRSIEVAASAWDIDEGFLKGSMGVFGGLEFARKGDITVAVGVKGSFGYPQGADLSSKGAIYLTSDSKGNIKDGGLKGTVEATRKFSEVDIAGDKISVSATQRVGEVKLDATDIKNMAVDFIPSFANVGRGANLNQ